MRTFLFLSISLLVLSCSEIKAEQPTSEKEVTRPIELNSSEFQSILDSVNVKGSILIYDPENETYHSNDFAWARRGNLPASTFKITNSIIALETEVVNDDSTLFLWDGADRWLSSWEQDLTLKEAFHFSCVPCYQEIARDIGAKQMNEHLTALNYGTMDVDSSNIDSFWLVGNSRINQFEQIDFLARFYQSNLSISTRTEAIMKRMMIIDKNDNYTLTGKTGWSIANHINNGWFVGYVETKEKAYFFATNVEPKEDFDINQFSRVRKEVTFSALEQLKIIEN